MNINHPVNENCFLDENLIFHKNISALGDILFLRNNEMLSQEALSLLMPPRIKDIVKNKVNLQILQLNNYPGEISIIIFEKNYYQHSPDYLKSYSDWKRDVKISLESQNKQKIRVRPKNPPEINELHVKFSSLIDLGKLSLSDRVLMTCRLRLHPENQEALYVGDFDGETRLGIGKDFYLNVLPTVCDKLGLKFIAGDNNAKNFTFYKNTLGRFTVRELKPEYQRTLFSRQIDNPFFTIQFVHSEDKTKYTLEK